LDLEEKPMEDDEDPSTNSYVIARWMVERRCEEFYQLSEQLRNFFGVSLMELPGQTSLFHKNPRIFMEINKIAFEHWLKTILKQVRVFLCFYIIIITILFYY
jgi:hypothetical protein